MTKKDYILFADMLANRFNKVETYTDFEEKRVALTEIVTIVEDICRILKNDNSRFDRVKFTEYVNKKRTGNGTLLA